MVIRMKYIASKRCALTLLLALAVGGGCSSNSWWTAANDFPAGETIRPVRIVYRTPSDRLNIAAAGQPGPQIAWASTGAPTSLLMPNLTTSTLEIKYPHPRGLSGMAQANVVIRRTSTSADDKPGFFARLTSWTRKSEQTAPQPTYSEVWSLDLPAWQVKAVVDKLRKDNFFQGSKVLNSAAYLGVDLNGKKFGKDYRAVPELDALILRVRREGRPLHQQSPPAYSRPPHVYQQAPRGQAAGPVPPPSVGPWPYPTTAASSY